MLRLKPVERKRRRYYATMIHMDEWGIELVIGARTKKAVGEAFAKLSPGLEADKKLIYHVEAREVKP
jgi:hypothetical protein